MSDTKYIIHVYITGMKSYNFGEKNMSLIKVLDQACWYLVSNI